MFIRLISIHEISLTHFTSFLFLLLTTTINAQFQRSTLDSLEEALTLAKHDSIRLNILDELKDRSEQLDFDSWIRYARQYLGIVKRRNSPDLLLEAYTVLCAAHGALSFYDSSFYYADLAMDLANKHRFNTAGILSTKATILEYLGKHDEAIYYFLKSIEKSDSAGYTDEGARNNLALIYLDRQEYYKAIELLDVVLALGERKNDIQMKAMSLHNLGAAYWGLGDRSKSMAYYEASLNYCLESNDSTGMAHNYEALAIAFFADSAYERGISTLKKSIDIFEKINDPFQVKNHKVKLAQVYVKLNRLDSAYQLVYPIYHDADTSTTSFYIEAVDALARIHTKRKDYLQALNYRELHSQLRDSTNRRLYDQQVLELEKTLEKEKLENEKKALEAEQVRLDLVNKQQLRAAITGISGAVIISIILFFSYKRKQRDNEILAHQNEEISNQKNELQQLSSFKEALTDMIAHDLKNSLHSMLNLSAKQTNADGRIIHRSSLFAYNLVNNMLDVSKFEEANMKLSLQMNTISSIVEEAILEVNSIAEARKVNILPEFDYAIHLNIDREMMVRVIINLLHNAIKYSPVGGNIYLTLLEQKGEVQLLIKDHGAGIPQEDLPHIFEKHWHSEKKIKNSPSASGLGLVYCKLVMEAHGGSIEAKSEVGEGTCFILHFTGVKYTADPLKKDSDLEVNVSLETNLQLSYQEHKTLKGLYPELSKIQVYEISKWSEVLSKLDELGFNNEWVETLRIAIQTGNESLLNELLKEPSQVEG